MGSLHSTALCITKAHCLVAHPIPHSDGNTVVCLLEKFVKLASARVNKIAIGSKKSTRHKLTFCARAGAAEGDVWGPVGGGAKGADSGHCHGAGQLLGQGEGGGEGRHLHHPSSRGSSHMPPILLVTCVRIGCVSLHAEHACAACVSQQQSKRTY